MQSLDLSCETNSESLELKALQLLQLNPIISKASSRESVRVRVSRVKYFYQTVKSKRVPQLNNQFIPEIDINIYPYESNTHTDRPIIC